MTSPATAPAPGADGGYHIAKVVQLAVVAALGGFLFGLVAYATWNLTNLAVLKGFPASIVPIDMAWGSLATMATSVLTVLLVRALPWVGTPAP